MDETNENDSNESQTNADESNENESPDSKTYSPWRTTAWICCTVIVGSVVACLVVASIKSEGFIGVTVTATDKSVEPKDHNIPFIKRTDALPDYQLIVVTKRWSTVKLGAKPNTSAVEGLEWTLTDPISVADIVGIRLVDQDKVLSDALTEVEVSDSSITSKGFRFDFETQRSLKVGLESFFDTPIGKTITTAFSIAILIVILAFFAPFLPI